MTKFNRDEINKFSDEMTEEQENKIKSIIDKLESESEWASDYYTRNEESPLAEYVGSIGYHGELMHEVEDRLLSIKNNSWKYKGDDRCEEICDYFLEMMKRDGSRKTAMVLVNLTELKPCGIHYEYWEICGATVGEVEWQVSDELSQEISKLTEIEIAYVEQMTGLNGDYLYIPCDYDRWALILDYEAACEFIDNENQIESSINQE